MKQKTTKKKAGGEQPAPIQVPDAACTQCGATITTFAQAAEVCEDKPVTNGSHSLRPAAVVKLLLKLLPDAATLDALDDDDLTGRRSCPVKFTIADVRVLRAVLTSPLTSEEQGALVALVNYNERDEREHYGDTPQGERSGHIYEHIKVLSLLTKRLAAAQSKKPERRGGKKR